MVSTLPFPPRHTRRSATHPLLARERNDERDELFVGPVRRITELDPRYPRIGRKALDEGVAAST